jgi:two-component system sensor histidine kinase SenX3
VSPTRLDVLAHELRSPVAALAAIAEAFPDADEPTRRRLVELAETAGASLERLLADITVATLRFERVDVGCLACDVVELAALRGSRVAAEADKGLIVVADPARLRQALDNLIGNAVGHSRAGETVTVTVRRADDLVEIAVADRGDGIDTADIERIFEPGVRLTEARPGSGLGLAVVREIAVEHGGEIEVASTPGRGTTFRLVLPAASGAS